MAIFRLKNKPKDKNNEALFLAKKYKRNKKVVLVGSILFLISLFFNVHFVLVLYGH